MTVRGIKLTGRAARWVQLLQDFGHLDADGADRLLVGVAELHQPTGDAGTAVADLPLVRRAAAMVLFPDAPASDGLMTVLDEDWPLLFS